MSAKSSTIKISKVDAAQRQLRTAIFLWFMGGDPVSIHALAFAAYEVLHAVSKKRNKYRRDLLFDSDWIKDEHRSEWSILLKKEAYFFKHGDRDPEAEIELNPDTSLYFIIFAVLARELCGHPTSQEESTLLWWLQIHEPKMLTEKGRKFVTDNVPIQVLEHLKGVSKAVFFEAWNVARNQAGAGGPRISTPRIVME